MTRLAVLLLALFALSCTAGVYPLHWAIDDGFTEEEEVLIRRAPDCWNEVSHIQQSVLLAGESPHHIVLTIGPLPGPYPDVGAVHVERSGVHTIYIHRLEPDLFLGTLQHEMGHAIGLAQMHAGGHIAPPAIMSSPSSSLVVTPNDLAECRHVGACD